MKAIGILLLSVGLAGALAGCTSNPEQPADTTVQRVLPRPRLGASFVEPANQQPLSREEYRRARIESELERFLGSPRPCSNPAGCQY
jgi:hypothetical protein